jgi:hypothetical protein
MTLEWMNYEFRWQELRQNDGNCSAECGELSRNRGETSVRWPQRPSKPEIFVIYVVCGAVIDSISLLISAPTRSINPVM